MECLTGNILKIIPGKNKMGPIRLKDYLKSLTVRFKEASFDSPDIESAYLLSEVTHIRHHLLMLHGDRVLTDAEILQAESYMARRLKQEPFQYIYGWTEFRYLKLFVGPGCLIPRSETELLVDHVIRYLKNRLFHETHSAQDVVETAGTQGNLPFSVCEVGIGSGAVSLSLAYEHPEWKVCGSEISPEALKWAELNRKTLCLQADFRLGSLLEPFKNHTFDVIVSNPPYIPRRVKESLPANVRDYEPDMALFAEKDGLAVIESLINTAPSFLNKNGALFLEIGEDQGQRVLDLVHCSNAYSRSEILKDQYGADRFLAAEKSQD